MQLLCQLHYKEQATKKKIERMELPSAKVLNDKRIDKFRQQITDVLAEDDLVLFSNILEQYQQEHNVPALEIAAALAKIAQGDSPLLVKDRPQEPRREFSDSRSDSRSDRQSSSSRRRKPKHDTPPEEGMARFRIEVGHHHKVMPGNIVGAIANEAGLDSKYIGRINIFDDYSTVDMPDEMPKEVFQHLQKVRVGGQQLKISRLSGDKSSGKRTFRGKTNKKVNPETDKKSFSKRKKPRTAKKPSRRKVAKD